MFLVDLLEQVGDTDLTRPTVEIEGDLDRRADVVRVHVTVPQAVTTDDHDRVTDRSPPLLEVVDAVIEQVEEVHDLVALLAHIELALGGRRAMGDRLERGTGQIIVGVRARLGQGVAGDHVERRVEQEQEPGPAGIDHAGLLEHRQLFGCVVQGPLAGLAGRTDHIGERATLVGRGPRRLCALAGDRQDRSLDRLEHRLIGAGRGRLQRFGERRTAMILGPPVGLLLQRRGEARGGSG